MASIIARVTLVLSLLASLIIGASLVVGTALPAGDLMALSSINVNGSRVWLFSLDRVRRVPVGQSSMGVIACWPPGDTLVMRGIYGQNALFNLTTGQNTPLEQGEAVSEALCRPPTRVSVQLLPNLTDPARLLLYASDPARPDAGLRALMPTRFDYFRIQYALSPDETRVAIAAEPHNAAAATTGYMELYLSDLATDPPTFLQLGDFTAPYIDHVRWSPDGTQIAFLAQITIGSVERVFYVVDASTGAARPLMSLGGAAVDSFAWRP